MLRCVLSAIARNEIADTSIPMDDGLAKGWISKRVDNGFRSLSASCIEKPISAGPMVLSANHRIAETAHSEFQPFDSKTTKDRMPIAALHGAHQ